MDVRPGREADLAGLLAVEDEFRRTGMAAWAVMEEPWFRRKLAHDELLVAEDGDGITGWLSWTVLWVLPWVEFVRVLQAKRRQGIGTALMRALEDRYRAADGYMILSSSTGTDADAIAWHRAIGYGDGGRIEWRMWPGAPPEVLHYKELWTGN
ncbi:MAG: N-acetyltransferase family protein [Actinomycetota bacterium]